MFKKLMPLVEADESVLALYAYAITKEVTIPVLIVQEFSSLLAQSLQHDHQAGWIILTQDDLQHGHDVYSVKLNHIIHCSSLVYGADLLDDVTISPIDLRPHLEGHIRHALIDIREGLAEGKWLGDMMPWLSIQCDRIWHACGYLLGVESYVVADIVAAIDDAWSIDHADLYKTVHHGTGVVDLYGVHEALLALVTHIDLLHKNTTN